MNYISLYIRRTFSKNLKKQVFLIVGIAAFMAALSMNVMIRDSNERNRRVSLEDSQWGFSMKVFDVSADVISFLKTHIGVERVDPVAKLELTAGPENVDYVVSSDVPEAWKLNLLYGEMPTKGEILLTENASISSRQPVPGETVLLEVRTGGEKEQIVVTVSGVAEAFGDFTGSYVFLYYEDFEELISEIPSEERKYDAFFMEKDLGGNSGVSVGMDLYEKLGAHRFLGWVQAGEEFEYSWREVLGGAMLITVFSGACLGAIIYIVLQDEKKNIGILRAIGARKSQAALLLTVRILLSGGIGILLGSVLTLVAREIERALLYTDTAIGRNAGPMSAVFVLLTGIVVLLLVQIPGIYALLKETPLILMNEIVYKGENLVSFKNRKLFRIKHPIWWYAGLEGKRLRGRSAALALITVLGMLFPTTLLLDLEAQLQSNVRDAVEETYTIEKINGYFTENEVKYILGMLGVKSAGFAVEQKGESIAEYAGEPVTVRLQILDESSFRCMKLQSEQMGTFMFANSAEELLGETGILVRPTMETIRKKITKGEQVTLFSPSGEPYECEIAFVAQNGGEIDADYYMFISYGRYCEIFGAPELRNFSVTLDETTSEKVEKALQQKLKGVSIKQNELLLGNTVEELNRDEVVSDVICVMISFLAAAAFLLCYNSFYYLSKTEEYRKLFAMGASKNMIRKIILSQALRMSWLLAVLNAAAGYIFYLFVRNVLSDQWVRENTTSFPLAGIIISVLLVMVISMSATWFASGQVLKELEQKA